MKKSVSTYSKSPKFARSRSEVQGSNLPNMHLETYPFDQFICFNGSFLQNSNEEGWSFLFYNSTGNLLISDYGYISPAEECAQKAFHKALFLPFFIKLFELV